LRGIEYASLIGWYSFQRFNLNEYLYYENFENGDLNWIIPGKLLAFSTPRNEQYDQEGYRNMTPKDYVPIFKAFNVGTVVRLNNKCYDETWSGFKSVLLKITSNIMSSIFQMDQCPRNGLFRNS